MANERVEVLEGMKAAGLSDQECIAVLLDVTNGGGLHPTDRKKREYSVGHGTATVKIALNAKSAIKSVMAPSQLVETLEKALADAQVQHPPRNSCTTLFSSKPIIGYARVDGWIQIRPTDSTEEDLRPEIAKLGGATSRDYPVSLEVLSNTSPLDFLGAHRWMSAINEARWLLAAFLDSRVYSPRGSYAYVTIDGKPSLAVCAAPILASAPEASFSDTENLTEILPVASTAYFKELGFLKNELRVPNLTALRDRYLRLEQADRQKFLRASATLFESSNPSYASSTRIVAAVTAIEALLDDGEKCKLCKSHTGLSKAFKSFVERFVSPPQDVLDLYEELYSTRSVIAHGKWFADFDEPMFGLSYRDVFRTELVAWAAVKRGLIGWLGERTGGALS